MAHDIILTSGASTFDIALTPPPQTVTPPMQPPIHQIGVVTIDQAAGGLTVIPGGIPTYQVTPNPSLVYIIAPAALPSSFQIGSLALLPTYHLTPTAIDPIHQIGAVTLTTLTTVQPAGISSGFQAGLPTLVPGGVFLTPIEISSGAQLGTVSLAQLLALFGIPTFSTAGSPQLNLSLSAPGIPSLAQPGSPQLNLAFSLSGSPPVHQTGVISLSMTYLLIPAEIPFLYKPSVVSLSTGAVSLIPQAIPPLHQLGSIALTVSGLNAFPAGIPTGMALGTPQLLPGAIAIAPNMIPSGAGAGRPQLNLALVPSAIPALHTAGAINLLPGAISLEPAAIPALHRTGSLTIVPGAIILLLAGVASPAQAGRPSIALTLTVGGRSALWGLGLHHLQTAAAVVTVAGIEGQRQLGLLDVFEAGIPYPLLLSIWLREGGTVIRYGDEYFQVVIDSAIRFVKLPYGLYLEPADHTRRWDGWIGPRR